MKERLITVVLSAIASLSVSHLYVGTQTTLDVDRLIVRKELIVSDTGQPWEQGFEAQQIPRGIYARPQDDQAGGLWVRGRLIKSELDDPFDDRFHAMNRDGSMFRAPGHISWNVWLDGAWRQLSIIQGEGLENSELAMTEWNGGSHPGRLRFQTFRPEHSEPLTDLLVGQGKASIGGGGFGGGGLPYPTEALEIWGGRVVGKSLTTPSPVRIQKQVGGEPHSYSIAAIAVDGTQSDASSPVSSNGLATLAWDSVPGADAYIVFRDGKPITTAIRIEGSQKIWQDPAAKN